MAASITVTTANPGNLAIETQAWSGPLSAWAPIVKAMKAAGRMTSGSYWTNHLGRPYNSARRSGADVLVVYTAGFSSQELAGWLAQ